MNVVGDDIDDILHLLIVKNIEVEFLSSANLTLLLELHSQLLRVIKDHIDHGCEAALHDLIVSLLAELPFVGFIYTLISYSAEVRGL